MSLSQDICAQSQRNACTPRMMIYTQRYGVTWHEVRGRNSDQNEAAQVAVFPYNARHGCHGRHPHGHAFHHGIPVESASTQGARSREGEVIYMRSVMTLRLTSAKASLFSNQWTDIG
jgi:hypothetical protein